VAIGGPVHDGRVLAGIALGADGEPGGTGPAADVGATASIRSLKLGGRGDRLVGLRRRCDATNLTFGDGDDVLTGGTPVPSAPSPPGGRLTGRPVSWPACSERSALRAKRASIPVLTRAS